MHDDRIALLRPGDCLVPLKGDRGDRGGLLLCIGCDDRGPHLMLSRGDRVTFSHETWSAVRASWEQGQTRLLSTFL